MMSNVVSWDGRGFGLQLAHLLRTSDDGRLRRLLVFTLFAEQFEHALVDSIAKLESFGRARYIAHFDFDA